MSINELENRIAKMQEWEALAAEAQAEADAIRDELLAKGITLLDTREGTKFTVEG